MPKQKLENTFRSWTKAEYFAHTKNAMAEKNLRTELTQLSKQNFNQHLKAKGMVQDVHDTVTPLKQTTGHYQQAKLMKNHPKKVTFTEDEVPDSPTGKDVQGENEDKDDSDTDQQSVQSNEEKERKFHNGNLEQRTETLKKLIQRNGNLSHGYRPKQNILAQDLKREEDEGKRVISKPLRSTQSLPTPRFSKLLKKRCQSAPTSFKPKTDPNEEPSSTDGSKLTLKQITRINAFYLAKHKKQFVEPHIPVTKHSKNSDVAVPNISKSSITKPIDFQQGKTNGQRRDSLWKKVTLGRVLALRDPTQLSGGLERQHGENISDSGGSKNDNQHGTCASKIHKMPRLYEVFLMAKARFQNKAAEAKLNRSRSLVSQSDVSEKSMGTGTEISSFLNSSFVESDSDAETVNVSFSDPLETFLWKEKETDSEDKDKKVKKKRKKRKERESTQEEPSLKDSEIEDESTHDANQIVSPHVSNDIKETNAPSKGGISSITVYLPRQEDSAVSFFTDTSEDILTDYITAPTYSLSLNTPARPCEREPSPPRPQTTPVHAKAMAFARTDTTQYQRIPGHWNYARKTVPIAQYIRTVEAGLAIDGFIEPVSDLRIQVSKGAIRRQRQDMVRSQDKTKTVNTDLEKARMQKIQNRINDFLSTFPKPKRSVFY